MQSSRKSALVLVLGAAVLTAAACGSNGSSGSATGGGKPTLAITSPAQGASVSAPFELKFTSNQPIGPTETGKDHVHLFVDGGGSYQVVTASPATVKGLAPGKHTLKLTLQHADHSPIGPQATITVTVTKGSSPEPGNSSPGSGGGYGY